MFLSFIMEILRKGNNFIFYRRQKWDFFHLYKTRVIFMVKYVKPRNVRLFWSYI